MEFIWTAIGLVLLITVFWMGARWVAGGTEKELRLGNQQRDDRHDNGVPLRDLGGNVNPSQVGNEADLWPDRTGARTRRELGARHAADVTFVGDREEQKLAPEDQYGEDRPANRTQAPDQPPTQWHPEKHGVPGDHIRDGHHRSATAPIKTADATDPYAHAPVPGPNHIIPEGGQELPRDTRP